MSKIASLFLQFRELNEPFELQILYVTRVGQQSIKIARENKGGCFQSIYKRIMRVVWANCTHTIELTWSKLRMHILPCWCMLAPPLRWGMMFGCKEKHLKSSQQCLGEPLQDVKQAWNSTQRHRESYLSGGLIGSNDLVDRNTQEQRTCLVNSKLVQMTLNVDTYTKTGSMFLQVYAFLDKVEWRGP